VQKDYRGKGITTKIIEKAIGDAVKSGYEIVEAYPKPKAKSDAGKYHGRYDVFKKLGFIEERIEGKCVMRKYLLSIVPNLGPLKLSIRRVS
jgi:GNAT superfamily N-acetyltransferase